MSRIVTRDRLRALARAAFGDGADVGHARVVLAWWRVEVRDASERVVERGEGATQRESYLDLEGRLLSAVHRKETAGAA